MKMIKKPNLALTVVLIIIIEGLAIYLNMVAHPKSQPGLTIFIVMLMALIFGFYTGYLSKKNKTDLKRDDIITKKGNFKYGIVFWTGAGVYSLINVIMNLKKINQNEILLYNYLIAGVAILSLILNIFLMKKSKK
jgi:hypothetical protein